MFDTRNKSWLKARARADKSAAKVEKTELALGKVQTESVAEVVAPAAPLDDYTYRDKNLSMWQSAASFAATNIRPAVLNNAGLDPNKLATALMAPVHAVSHAVEDAQDNNQHLGSTAPNFGFLGNVSGCAKLAAELLWAELKGDHAAVNILENRLKYAVCDVPGWAECVTQYAHYKLSQAPNPYRPSLDIVKTVLSDSAKIAILGDWGTGDQTAVDVLEQVKALQPDIVIHLGDVYFAGTDLEMTQNFLQVCHSVLGPNVPLYTLCGNHDMYSGGAPYYRLLDTIGQKSSYFCLRGNAWQIVAVDTGNNDNNPITVSTNMTKLNKPEVQWIQDKIHTSGGRRTILLSHHQLFSPFGSVGSVDNTPYCFNPNLYDTFKSVLPQIDLWLWGHEHTLAVYDPYMGLKRGRCVGCSAIPVFSQPQSYERDTSLHTFDGTFPTWQPAVELGNDTIDFYHGFAMIALNAQTATVDYYQVPMVNPAATRLYSEQL